MRILLATGIFPPQIGGPATYSKLLYDELSKHGIKVEVANFGDHLDKPKIIRHFAYFWELLEKAPDVDLIYALDPVSVGLPALLASQVRGKKLVLRVAGDYAWEQGTQRFGVTDTLDEFAKGEEKYSLPVRMLKKVQKYVAMGATKIIVPSNYLKSILTDWGVDDKKITVIYNGFHLTAPKSLKTSLRKRLGLTGSVVLTAGRLVPWKGIKELIGAMPALIAQIPDANLVVVGSGPQEEELKAKVKELGLDSVVKFVGRLDQKDLFEYIKAADVFALNTSYEGLSHQLLETMAIGTPIVTTNIGGNPETIKHGKTGVLLKPNDMEGFVEAISGLLSERAIAAMLSQAAKKSVGKFTDEAMLENIARELKNI